MPDGDQRTTGGAGTHGRNHLLDGLTPDQRRAVAHGTGRLLVAGGAGTGKTRTLVARFAWLVEQGTPPEAILALTFSSAAADALRTRIEDAIDRPYEELAVTTMHGFCARLLRDEAAAAGLDPFAQPVTPADRLAMLLERIDELTLRRHDLRGNPAALLGGVIERIDRLKEELVEASDYAVWAATLRADDPRAAQEREFAGLYQAHDRMLSERGALDFGDLLLVAHRLLRDDADVRARAGQRHGHVLVDDYQDLNLAQVRLLELLVCTHDNAVYAADDDQSILRFRGAATKNVAELDAPVVRLGRSFRCRTRILDAAKAVIGAEEKELGGDAGGEIAFWRATNERAQAQAVAADIERRIAREGLRPDQVAVLVRSVRNEGQEVAVALEERAVPFRLVGAAAFFQRAEIRDVLAWLRLLADPGDAGAVVRALARPPIELRSVDLARCIQISRRRKLDMVSALVAATESPQLPPESRERILHFLRLHKAGAGQLDTVRPDLFVQRLIERLGLRRQQLFAAQADVVERLVNLAKLSELATQHVRRAPQATSREFARYIAAVAEAGLQEEEASVPRTAPAVQVMTMHAAKGLEFDAVYVLGLQSARMPGARRRAFEPIPDALLHEDLPPDSRIAHVGEMRRLLHVAMTRARRSVVLAYPERSEAGAVQQPSPFAEDARTALGGVWEEREEELFGPAETLHATARALRGEVLDAVSAVGGRLGELRLDTDLDVSHAIVRYLELLKLGALIQRPTGQTVEETLPAINARLGQGLSAEQREVFETSTLDDFLLGADADERRRAAALHARAEPSLEAFLPRRGAGLVLSASDVETYLTCPLKYKFARVFRIPQEPTVNQRFGILVHQVLERYHAVGGESKTLAELLGLLEAGWRRGGFGDSDEERQLRSKAIEALTRYHERFQSEPADPVWLERAFSFRLGEHLVRGRVDRVDRLPDGGYELIDYKTGRPKTAAQLKADVQLSLYAVGAREAWQLEAAQQAYYYVLDDAKVPVQRDSEARAWITDTVLEVADGIMSQGFEPTPSYAACSMCDYRIVCPAAER
jgi:DNA helicase II / ATP-dependent DNA helicase PcrA